MKKKYIAPTLEIEFYELNASIASNCALVVTMGPEAPDAITVCDDYYEKTGEERGIAVASSMPYNVQFWESCDCYTTAGGSGCFTS